MNILVIQLNFPDKSELIFFLVSIQNIPFSYLEGDFSDLAPWIRLILDINALNQ